ncbi:MAG: 50S ribosomal protein L25 [Candidatus Kerfeldbacteria bacterium]|nr:50S ribosomal protein L25 [Candidatus Kerfeldbacteria bacterium]
MPDQTFSLQAQTRTVTGKGVAGLRNQSIIPGVVYGHGVKNRSLQLDLDALSKVYADAGRGSLINLSIDGGNMVPVVIHELSLNNLTDAIEHVDFYAVKMDEEITSQAMLVFTGEAPAVKALGGTFIRNKDHVTIKCLPSKLVKELTIDISNLATFTDNIKVKDLALPDGVIITDGADDILAAVAAPRTDEELAALNQTVTEDVSKVEGVVKPTTEEAAAEGVKDNKETKDSKDKASK